MLILVNRILMGRLTAYKSTTFIHWSVRSSLESIGVENAWREREQYVY